MKKLLLSSAILATFALFTACGDDVTEVTEIHQDGMAVLDAGLELSKQKCDTTNVGDMLFVTDSSEVFVCNGKTWLTLKGVDGENGKDGVGKDGVGCSVKDEGDGTVTVTCGDDESVLHKAACGTEPYDPTKSFCSDGKLYSCNDEPYDPTKSFCSEGELYELCDGETYDPAKSFCSAGEVYELCDGKTYDPAKSFCSEGELYSCNDVPYDPAKSFCSGGEVYELCDGKTYDPKEQYCLKVTRGETDIYSVEALLTDARDKQHYKTVKICNDDTSSCQTWMAENLNYSGNPGTPSWCYRDSAEYCEKYGRLYTWAAAIDSVALAHDAYNPQTCGYGKTCTLPAVVQGVCPAGWHLPSKAEWDTLFTYVGGKASAGTVLKSTSGWNDDINGGDDYGFAVLPAGYTYFDKYNYFYAVGDDAYFWSSTEEADSHAYSEYFHYSYSGVNEYYEFPKYKGFSVRCLKD